MSESAVIDVRDCRAIVSAFHLQNDGTLMLVPAENWESLESSAVDAVEQQGGSVNMSGQYVCPPDLAAQAKWGRASEEGDSHRRDVPSRRMR